MDYLKKMEERYPALLAVSKEVNEAYEIMKNSYENGGKLFHFLHNLFTL